MWLTLAGGFGVVIGGLFALYGARRPRPTAVLTSPPASVVSPVPQPIRPPAAVADLGEKAGAFDYGNECFKSWRANDLEVAERYCDIALAKPDATGTVLASLYFNKGLIAESRGSREDAINWFRASLRIRSNQDPGRLIVQKAIQRVQAVP